MTLCPCQMLALDSLSISHASVSTPSPSCLKLKAETPTPEAQPHSTHHTRHSTLDTPEEMQVAKLSKPQALNRYRGICGNPKPPRTTGTNMCNTRATTHEQDRARCAVFGAEALRKTSARRWARRARGVEARQARGDEQDTLERQWALMAMAAASPDDKSRSPDDKAR